MGHIQRFGMDVFCHVPSEKRGKLDSKAIKLKFVGYSEVSKAYRLLDPRSGKSLLVAMSSSCRAVSLWIKMKWKISLWFLQSIIPW